MPSKKMESAEPPIDIVFSIGYLNGVMEHEQSEIRLQWERVRDYVLKDDPVLRDMLKEIG